ncbi:MAG: formate-dependent phosphoribosylglycinamide formyltransferase (GAR transformylase) [Planctomycetota bacterium]|jgi:formate-dependent phosphoribosylglycinamide formyltransferase (GAR transformylase)
MLNVAFAIPFALESSMRFLRAAARLEGVRLGVISQEGPGRLPEDLRSQVAAHVVVEDAMDAKKLAAAVTQLGQDLGAKVDRLIGILEPLQEPMAQAREALGIRGMDYREAILFRDKARMKTALREAGLPCARHATAESAAEARTAAEKIGYPLVAKPPDGAGAKATIRVENPEQLASYLRSAPPRVGKPLLLEEFVQGREFSFDSVSLGGRQLLNSISTYHPTPLQVMESPWIQWVVHLPREIDGPEFEAIHEAGPKALDTLGMVTGITHMEWFRRPDGSIAISEVAARPPGAQITTLLSAAYDFDFYAAWSRLLVFEEFEAPERKYSAGAVYLRGQGEGRVRAVRGFEELQRELGSVMIESKIPAIGTPASSSYEGEGYVLLRHTDSEIVERGLSLVLKTLRVDLG